MYIGDTDDLSGLHHMVFELVDNSIDEAQVGYSDHVAVTIHADNSVTVEDNGRGIPVGMHKEHKRETLEIIMTDLHSGGKFDDNSYKVSGGLHGVGVSVVNALSRRLDVEVRREGRSGSRPTSAACRWRRSRRSERPRRRHEGHLLAGSSDLLGDRVPFRQPFAAAARALVPESRRAHLDRRRAHGEEARLRLRGRDRSFVEHLNKTKQPIHDKVIFFLEIRNGTGDVKRDADKERVEVALQWNEGYAETLFSFTNTINNRDGGTHVEGFRQP